MKSVYLIAAIGTFAATAVHGQCACAPTDSACLSECVGQTNSCISACKSNDCYSSCISDHWPGVDSSSSKASFVVAVPSSTAATAPSNSVGHSPSSSASKPSSPSSSAVPTSSWSSAWSETSSSIAPTSSSAWSQSSAHWTSSSAWSSGSTWVSSHTVPASSSSNTAKPTGINPASPSASILPASGAATMQMSKVIVGLGLACAAYILQ